MNKSTGRRDQGGLQRVQTHADQAAVLCRALTALVSTARCGIAFGLLSLCTVPAMAQSFRVQCPPNTITHPAAANNNSEPAYLGPTQFTRPATGTQQWVAPTASTVNGAIKCQQIGGGDGYST